MIMMIGMTVILIGGLGALAYTLAIYALPVALALWAARLAFATGAGWIGAGLIGLVAATASFWLLVMLFVTLRPPILRIAVALIFAVPAAIAGHAIVHGVTIEAVPSPIWREVFAIIGGTVTGFSALARLVNPPGRD